MSEIKLFMKLQAVISVSAEIAEWFIKLYLEINIKTMQYFYVNEVKKVVEFKPNFTLVVKCIFNREKAQKPTRSFINKNNSRLKGLHIEVVGE